MNSEAGHLERIREISRCGCSVLYSRSGRIDKCLLQFALRASLCSFKSVPAAPCIHGAYALRICESVRFTNKPCKSNSYKNKKRAARRVALFCLYGRSGRIYKSHPCDFPFGFASLMKICSCKSLNLTL